MKTCPSWQSRIQATITCVVLFGVLMAVRSELSPMWTRAVIAVLACIVLGWAIIRLIREMK
jgi:hypothetical protein